MMKMGELIEHKDYLVQPDGFNIPFDAERIHGISTELAQEQGVPLSQVLEEFNEALGKAKFVVGQNVGFDNNIMGCEFHRLQVKTALNVMPVLDTCTEKTADLCKIPGGRGGKYKLPTLTELHEFLFHVPFAEAHNATADVEATARCFFELLRTGNYSGAELEATDNYLRDFLEKNRTPFESVGLTHVNLKEESARLKEALAPKETGISDNDLSENKSRLKDVPFSHLHNHSQFSVLQSTTKIGELVQKAGALKCPGVALTDTGNMMAAFHFVRDVLNYNRKIEQAAASAAENGEVFDEQPLVPIVGCEFNVCNDHLDKTQKDNGYRVVMLAKNHKGLFEFGKNVFYRLYRRLLLRSTNR